MSPFRLWSGFTRNRAFTHPRHENLPLRGRTYAIPFARVWRAALELASGGLRGWTLLQADEDLGVLKAESRTLLFRFVDDVEVRISLDENGQTRVDMVSESRVGKGDLGKNASRIRKFFRHLDRKLGAGPSVILDPTRYTLLSVLLSSVLIGCGSGEEAAPGEVPAQVADSVAPRNFQGRSYERHIVFLTALGDSTLMIPWSFSATTRPGAVTRVIQAWLARSDTWDPFVQESWETPPTRSPWQILPRGPARIIVTEENALERIYFEEGARELEVILKELLVEWTGQQAQTFRLYNGATLLSGREVEGFVLDISRAWTRDDPRPGDWVFLLSGDSLQLVLENHTPDDEPGDEPFVGWVRLGTEDRRLEDLVLTWSEIRSYEPARRDVPMGWELGSEGGRVSGQLQAVSTFFQVGEGEGPMLPVDALYSVSGTFGLDGAQFPVRGFIRHHQH